MDLYGYATFTTRSAGGIAAKMRAFTDRLQRIAEHLPLRVVPLEIQVWGPVAPRMRADRHASLGLQQEAVAVWRDELTRRFAPSDLAAHPSPVRGRACRGSGDRPSPPGTAGHGPRRRPDCYDRQRRAAVPQPGRAAAPRARRLPPGDVLATVDGLAANWLLDPATSRRLRTPPALVRRIRKAARSCQTRIPSTTTGGGIPGQYGCCWHARAGRGRRPALVPRRHPGLHVGGCPAVGSRSSRAARPADPGDQARSAGRAGQHLVVRAPHRAGRHRAPPRCPGLHQPPVRTRRPGRGRPAPPGPLTWRPALHPLRFWPAA